MGLYLLIDFGSTYTKVVAMDPEKEIFIGRAQSLTTVHSDITIGLKSAMDNLYANFPDLRNVPIDEKIACSSAAGGLNLIAIGLVPELTVEAARRAALGAGAKVISTYSYELSKNDIREIERSQCDIILLVGGTDGGNKQTILHNALMIANSDIDIPIVIAGNKAVAHQISDMLSDNGKIVEVTENILPTVDELNEEPARTKIREIFIKRIVKAKGLESAQSNIGNIIMPTPMANLKTAQLLAEGTDQEPGLGDLILIEIGGATTNIHSIANGYPRDSKFILKGLPEPYAKRTVEGDLGLRYNAPSIYQCIGEKVFCEKMQVEYGKVINHFDYNSLINSLPKNVNWTPEDTIECSVDMVLAETAAGIAMSRHAGSIKEVFSAMGPINVQFGKDLTGVKTVIGTGGIFHYGKNSERILKGVLFNSNRPWELKPKNPSFYIDKEYIMYAIGLLSERFPTAALRIAKKYLMSVT